MKKLIKNQKGMTLIELLAVIVIIAIIALIAIPAIGNIISNSKDKAILSDASNIISGAKIAYQDGACSSDTSEGASNDICSQTELTKFVDISDSSATYEVKVTNNAGSISYGVKYSKFSDIKNSKYTVTADDTGYVPSADINSKMK